MVIYKIENLVNGNFYIGQTTYKKPIQRWQSHKSDLRKNKHCNRHLQFAWNKYGPASFKFDIIERCNNLEELNLKEVEFIVKLKPIYNLRPGGDNSTHSDETKRLISKISTARFANPEKRKQMSEQKINQYRENPELCKLISEKTKLGMTDVVRDKLSKTYDGFISPGGTVYRSIRNLNKFCKEHKLNRGNMIAVYQGIRPHAQGWTKYNA